MTDTTVLDSPIEKLHITLARFTRASWAANCTASWIPPTKKVLISKHIKLSTLKPLTPITYKQWSHKDFTYRLALLGNVKQSPQGHIFNEKIDKISIKIKDKSKIRIGP